MREIRLSGSEGGGTGTTRSFLPLSAGATLSPGGSRLLGSSRTQGCSDPQPACLLLRPLCRVTDGAPTTSGSSPFSPESPWNVPDWRSYITCSPTIRAFVVAVRPRDRVQTQRGPGAATKSRFPSLRSGQALAPLRFARNDI